MHSGAEALATVAQHRAVAALRDVSALLYQHGRAYGTCGNYSIVLDRAPLRLLITASGKDKRQLAESDFLVVGEDGMPSAATDQKPSAEALLHTTLAAWPSVGSVLHTHSIWNTLLSEWFAGRGAVRIAGYEFLKGLAGITTHETAVEVPIFENTQDMTALAAQLRSRLNPADPPPHAFLIRGHGLYAWGRDLAEARRHVEVLEFLFELVGRRDARG